MKLRHSLLAGVLAAAFASTSYASSKQVPEQCTKPGPEIYNELVKRVRREVTHVTLYGPQKECEWGLMARTKTALTPELLEKGEFIQNDFWADGKETKYNAFYRGVEYGCMTSAFSKRLPVICIATKIHPKNNCVKFAKKYSKESREAVIRTCRMGEKYTVELSSMQAASALEKAVNNYKVKLKNSKDTKKE